MTGLEKILKSISDEAEESAEKIISRANEDAEQIILQGKRQAEEQAAEIIKKSEKEADVIIERAMSAVALEKKRKVLRAKQEHIRSLIEEAKNSIIKLPENDYFTVILKMIEKFATSESGEIIFSPFDRERLSNDFHDKLNRVMNFKGGTLKISNEVRNISGGFILVYGGIEENCSFDALFESANDRLCDCVNELLFS